MEVILEMERFNFVDGQAAGLIRRYCFVHTFEAVKLYQAFLLLANNRQQLLFLVE
jgi:hypothetical protein